MNRLTNQQGIGIIKLILLTPLILIALTILLVIFSLLYKAYWDYRVEQMCEKDGGRTVYEVIKLPEEELSRMRGNNPFISLPSRRYAKTTDKFIFEFEAITLHRGVLGLEIYKVITRIIRLKDGKVVAEKISYGRSHGDFIPLPAVHHTSFSCPLYKDNLFLERIFIPVN